MDERLENFMGLGERDFVERMKGGMDEDFELLDKALETNWPTSSHGIIFWVLKIIDDGMTRESLVDTACTILYRLVTDGLVGCTVLSEIYPGLIKILTRKKYHYARFRAARIISLIGMDETLQPVLFDDGFDFDQAIMVLIEFSQDSTTRETALSDLAQID